MNGKTRYMTLASYYLFCVKHKWTDQITRLKTH